MANRYKEVADLIKAKRKELGISKVELAELTGLSYPTLWRSEKGEKAINMDTFLKISNALGL